MEQKAKERLDVYMVDKQLAGSREKAKKLILEGGVLVNGLPATKAGQMLGAEDVVVVTAEPDSYASRGGRKLEKMLEKYGICLTNCVCMDIGASTGGFTDACLQHGAVKVYAIDVGTGQLAKELLEDERVINLEQTNARYLEEAAMGEKVDFVCMDVSFISVTKMFPAVALQMKPEACLVCLVKPQFEAGREHIGKNGIVERKRKVHIEVIHRVVAAAKENGLLCEALEYSPITGGSGNIEYLLLAHYSPKKDMGKDWDTRLTERIVDEAFLYHSKSNKG